MYFGPNWNTSLLSRGLSFRNQIPQSICQFHGKAGTFLSPLPRGPAALCSTIFHMCPLISSAILLINSWSQPGKHISLQAFPVRFKVLLKIAVQITFKYCFAKIIITKYGPFFQYGYSLQTCFHGQLAPMTMRLRKRSFPFSKRKNCTAGIIRRKRI